MPPLVTIRTARPASARASSSSLPSYERGVEDRDAGIGGGAHDRCGLLLVRRKAHIAEPDPELGRIEPAGHPGGR
jgi:hypothetical protein